MVQPQAQCVVVLLHQPVQADAQPVAVHQPANLAYIHDGDARIEIVLVARRKTASQFAEVLLALFVAVLLDQAQLQAVLPGQHRLLDLSLDLRRVVAQRQRRVHAQDEVDAYQDRLGVKRRELQFLGAERPGENRLHLQTQRGVVVVAGHVDDTADELAVDIGPDKYAGLATLLDMVHRVHGLVQVGNTGLEQLVPGKDLQHTQQFAGLVLRPAALRHLHDGLDLAAQYGNVPGIHVVYSGRVQADEAVLAHYPPTCVKLLDLHVVRVGAPVHARAVTRLGETQLFLPQFFRR